MEAVGNTSSSTPAGKAVRNHRRRSAQAAALVTMAVVGLAGCSGLGSGEGSTAGSAEVQSRNAADAPVLEQPAAGGDKAGAPSMLLPSERSVIATASREVRVDDVALALPLLTAIASSNNGYVSSEDSATDPDDPTSMTAVVVLRVPTDRLSQALAEVAELGEVLVSRQDVQDVTEQVVDVDSRVASARASVARIRVLLDRASSISDVVRIESELAQREATLESMLAQQRSLRDLTDYATVTVSLVGAATPAVTDPDDGFMVGLERGWDAFTAAITWTLTVLGALLPFLVLASVVALPVAAAWRRRRPAPQAAADDVPHERENAAV